ncbi:MAG TPA: SDR family oxidoreductase [Acidimicrobiales bacterium]|nr:SDR family oxidoreductase [Acidimicrobiales bacterium]
MTRTDNSAVPDYGAMLRLDGRRIVVVGAGNGIGRQASHAMAMMGARLCCVDIEPDLAAEVAEEVGGTAVVGDMRQRADATRVFDAAVAALGGIDGVVGIPGTSHWEPITEIPDADWDAQHDLILRYAYLAIQLGARAMQGGPGSMVFVASVSGLFAAPRHAAYGAFKAGMMALVKSAAQELGPGIRVNAVAPGAVRTPRWAHLVQDPARTAVVPLQKMAETSDIAAAILFLMSPLAGHITGHTIVVDGGTSIRSPFALPGGAP